MTAVTLKAYGDIRVVTANRDGTTTTQVGKQVVLTEVAADGRIVLMPRTVVQHAGNMLAIPVCAPTEHGVETRFDQWQLFDMLRERLLPGDIPTLDPRGGVVADVALRYVLQGRHLANEALADWMSAALAASGLEMSA